MHASLNTSRDMFNVFSCMHSWPSVFDRYMTEIANECLLGSYDVASQIVHMTASSPLGPWTRVGIALAGFAHNPQVNKMSEHSPATITRVVTIHLSVWKWCVCSAYCREYRNDGGNFSCGCCCCCCCCCGGGGGCVVVVVTLVAVVVVVVVVWWWWWWCL
jgi:hypothetical protein